MFKRILTIALLLSLLQALPARAATKIIDCPLDAAVQKEILTMCEENNISYTFVMAVIAVETGDTYRADLVSASNDYGLMQINKCNHSYLSKTLNITDWFDPIQNASAGIYMLTDLFNRYEDRGKVLMCYNMGEGTARKLWNKGIYSSKYSRAVLDKQEELDSLLGN